MDCSVKQSALMDCWFEVLFCGYSDSYPCRREVTAVVDYSVDESAEVDCVFTGEFGIAALWLSIPVGFICCVA